MVDPRCTMMSTVLAPGTGGATSMIFGPGLTTTGRPLTSSGGSARPFLLLQIPGDLVQGGTPSHDRNLEALGGVRAPRAEHDELVAEEVPQDGGDGSTGGSDVAQVVPEIPLCRLSLQAG